MRGARVSRSFLPPSFGVGRLWWGGLSSGVSAPRADSGPARRSHLLPFTAARHQRVAADHGSRDMSALTVSTTAVQRAQHPHRHVRAGADDLVDDPLSPTRLLDDPRPRAAPQRSPGRLRGLDVDDEGLTLRAVDEPHPHERLRGVDASISGAYLDDLRAACAPAAPRTRRPPGHRPGTARSPVNARGRGPIGTTTVVTWCGLHGIQVLVTLGAGPGGGGSVLVAVIGGAVVGGIVLAAGGDIREGLSPVELLGGAARRLRGHGGSLPLEVTGTAGFAARRSPLCVPPYQAPRGTHREGCRRPGLRRLRKSQLSRAS